MKTVREPSRRVPVVAEADVVVCACGRGGFSAAIAAVRHGARVVLIERYGFPGGLTTAGLVAPIFGHTASQSDAPIVEGILREITIVCTPSAARPYGRRPCNSGASASTLKH